MIKDLTLTMSTSLSDSSIDYVPINKLQSTACMLKLVDTSSYSSCLLHISTSKI